MRRQHVFYRRTISIHAPREGGDFLGYQRGELVSAFQSTPPARGATNIMQERTKKTVKFQSTPPARGATICRWRSASRHFYFNPRPPRGGRLQMHKAVWLLDKFQSTPPARGATASATAAAQSAEISIHAPREGGDDYRRFDTDGDYHFNPRPPRGGRQQRCTVLPADL